MRTVPVTLGYDFDGRALIGHFTFDESRLPPGTDWILAPWYRVVALDASGQPSKIRVLMLGAIDVRQHERFPVPRPSRLARLRDLARRVLRRHLR